MPFSSRMFRPNSLYFTALACALSTVACAGGDEGNATPDDGLNATGEGGSTAEKPGSNVGGSTQSASKSAAGAKGGSSAKSETAEGGDATADDTNVDEGGSSNTDRTTNAGGASNSSNSRSAGGTRGSNTPAEVGGSTAKSTNKGSTSSGGAKSSSSKQSAGGTSSTTKPPTVGGAQNSNGSSTGGAASTTVSSGPTCHPKFSSGVNVAWFNFAADIPSPDIAKFKALFQNVKAVGGSAVRWWFHTTGTTTPGYDSSGKAKPITDAHIADLKKILDAAHEQNVGVVISLWSFGMLDSGQTSNATVRENNKKLLEQDEYRQAYIDNVLTKMVTALKGYPGLYAWEIFNEPEGMSSDNGGWTNPTDGRTKSANLQKTVNWFTSAIHDADASALVTNGANNFATLSPSHGTNLWSDAALTKAGGKANGVLDFYEAHYYNNWNGADANSPFKNPASYWGLDKDVVIGEFWTDTTDGVPANDLFTKLYSNTYAGAWAWQYANVDNPGPTSGASTPWPAMKTPMNNLYTAHAADLTCQ
ncbi:MAG TPA: hypothetical protein VKP30_20640 [Polyangiaceae bacterium]|nr:hypothetical protein [Polyangiaceae bacterium]